MSIKERWFRYFDQPMPNIILRIAVMLIGVILVAFGIALSRATDLGISPISCIPGVLNYWTGFSLGTITFIFNVLLLLSQVAILRRKFKPLQFLCILFLFVFAWFIDLFLLFTLQIPMTNYAVRLLLSIVSCGFIAVGVWLQKKAALILLPGDGVVQSISAVTGIAFGKMKVINDVSLIAVGSIISLVAMGGLFGVREGSIIAAVLVGFIIKFIDGCFPNFDQLVPVKGHPTLTADE